MIVHIDILKTALISRVLSKLYDYYYERRNSHACTLVFNKYLSIDYLAVSTKRRYVFNKTKTVSNIYHQVINGMSQNGVIALALCRLAGNSPI